MSKKNRNGSESTEETQAMTASDEQGHMTEADTGSDEGFQKLTFDFEGWFQKKAGEVCQGIILKRMRRPTEGQPNGVSYIVKLTKPALVVKTKEAGGGSTDPVRVPAGTVICLDESKALEEMSGAGQYPGEYECRVTCLEKRKSGTRSYWKFDIGLKQIGGKRRALPSPVKPSKGDHEDEDEDFDRF